MILVDANILLYAEDRNSANHERSRVWWDRQLSGESGVCLCWMVLNAFIRIATNHRVYENPLSLKAAIDRVQSWFEQPCTRLVYPTERHWIIFTKMLLEGQAHANLVTDAHLAALAVEYGCTLYSTDSDFTRFPTLKYINPLRD